MAATIYGFSTDEMKPQPGLSISRSDTGGWSATHEIAIKASDLADVLPNFARGTLLSTVDPDVPPPFDDFLKIDTVQILRTEGDLIMFNVTATGGSAQFENDELQPDALPTYTLTGQLRDVPFSEHPKWKALNDQDKYLLGLIISEFYQFDIANGVITRLDESTGNFVEADEQLTSSDAVDFATRLQQGQTTYQQSAYTWSESTEGTDQLTPDQIDNLGKIATPRGTPPEPTGTFDWMLTSVSQSQSGDLYSTNLEWTLSEEDGWDTFLYGP